MTKHTLIAIATLFASFAAHAADPVPAPAKPVTTVAAAQPAAATPPKATPIAQKTTGHSQQDKMRECSKQATGKKGAERKAFMKTCLSKKA